MTVPLPRAAIDEHNLQGGRLLYTIDQMRAYGDARAAEAVVAERGACAKLCETTKFTGNTFPVTTMEQLRMDIGAAIRARGTK